MCKDAYSIHRIASIGRRGILIITFGITATVHGGIPACRSDALVVQLPDVILSGITDRTPSSRLCRRIKVLVSRCGIGKEQNPLTVAWNDRNVVALVACASIGHDGSKLAFGVAVAVAVCVACLCAGVQRAAIVVGPLECEQSQQWTR